MASKTSTKLLRVLKTDDPDFDAAWQQFCQRSDEIALDLDDEVRSSIQSIREGGDVALKAAVRAASGFRPARIEVTREEWDEGCEAADPADRAAIGKAAMRIREFHRKRVPSSWEMREEGGAYMGHRLRPLARVGICVPTVGASPSSVIMNVTPASVVEVPQIVLSAPPREDGTIAPELLIAARVAGVHRVFKMGGAMGIAALAYGTASVSRVDRIVGGGDDEIEAAKRVVANVVGVTAQAGLREVCILADKTATPAWLAADLLSQAEHGEPAHTVFITHYKGILTRVQDQLTRQLKALGKTRIVKQALSARGIAVVTRNLEESLAVADRYAPEHLVLAVDAPELAAKQIQNAGAIFLGHYTPVAVGDYLAGPNHVLPAGGTARFGSPLGVEDFLKRTSFIKFEPPKLRELGADIMRLAQVEGLAGHGTSVELRLQKIRRARREREAAREAEL
ncbi:MAG: histidinol dehydrogenase [Deltaproteobacteria bacterium]|nr:histidinol dehydrogenase [Deltaproteobacteria bacterium]